MDIETRVLEDKDCEVELKVKVPEDRTEAAKREAARKLAGRLTFPGFRKGKVPYEMVRRRVGDAALLEEALDSLGQDVYREALNQSGIDPYAPGQLADMALNPLVLTFHIPVPPTVELGDYRSVRVEYSAPDVTEKQVDEALAELLNRKAELAETEDAAKLGDQMTIDVAGVVLPTDADDEEAEEEFLLSDEGVALVLDEKLDWPVPGMAEHLVGMKAGDNKSVTTSLPAEYPNEELAGRTVRLEVDCVTVQTRTLPEWTDELAKEFGQGAPTPVETVADLRAALRGEIEAREKAEAENDHAEAAVDKMIEGAAIKFPAAMLEREIDDMMQNMDRRLKEQNLSLEEYYKLSGRTEAEVRAEFVETAIKRLKRSLTLGKLIAEEGLHVHQEDVDAAVEKQLVRFMPPEGQEMDESTQQLVDMLRGYYGGREMRESFELDLLSSAAIQRARDIAMGLDPAKGMTGHDHGHDHAAEAVEEAMADAEAEVEAPKKKRAPRKKKETAEQAPEEASEDAGE